MNEEKEDRVPRVELHEDRAVFVAHDPMIDATRQKAVVLISLVKQGSNGELLQWANVVLLNSINSQLRILNASIAAASRPQQTDAEVMDAALKKASEMLSPMVGADKVEEVLALLRRTNGAG